jgi:hypothetical protein
MSAAEIAARLLERGYNAWERRTLQATRRPDWFRHLLAPHLARATDWRTAALAARARSSTRWFASAQSLDTVRQLLLQRYPAGNAAAVRHADLGLTHRVEYFGQVHDLGCPIEWHRDPVSGKRWPLHYHGDLPVGCPDDRFGDVKDVWEPGRCQWLVDLAKAWLLTEKDDYADTARAAIASWIDANPVGFGVHWAGPLEPAYRALSWLWVYYLLRGRLDADQDFHLSWLGSFGDHGWYLNRHLELHSSPYNHLIGEATALYCIGTMFPEFREAAAWRTKSRRVLEDRLADQFYADGGSVEQATLYHHATLGFYLIAALIGRVNEDEFSASVWTAIERGLEFTMHLTQPDGALPAIGDTDDAKPIRMERRDAWDFRHFLSAGAVLFQRGDFKFVAGAFHEDALWLLGPAGAVAFDSIEARPPRVTSVSLPTSGYVVLRSGWSADADYVCFDCGEQAGGLRHDAIPSAAHGHADCLAVVASLNGHRVLVDAGFYTYNRERSWERHFRETAAHNTVRVDGADQAIHEEKMAWTHAPRATLEAVRVAGAGGWAVGTHDGYARSGIGVIHRRAVWLRPGGYLIVFDELIGAGEHVFEASFLGPPGATGSWDGSTLFLGTVGHVSVAATSTVEGVITAGGTGPHSGWVAPGLGIKLVAPRLILRGRFTDRARILTVVGTPQHSVNRLADAGGQGALAFRVAGPDYLDVVSADGEAGPSDISIDGLVTAWCMQPGKPTVAEGLGGSGVASVPPPELDRNGDAVAW